MKIETSVFWEAVSQGDTHVTNIHEYMKDLVSFYNFIQNQKEIYLVEDNVVEDSLKDMYEKFGITSNEYKIERSNYLFIVDPLRDLTEQYNEFFDTVEENCIPTHLVVLSNDKDVCIKVLNEVKASYPDIILSQDVTRELTGVEIADKIKRTLNTDRVFDVTSYCEELSKEFRTSPRYLDLFDSIVDRIHNENTEGLIYICSGDYVLQNTYTYLVVELFLRYSDRFYCTPNQMTIVQSRVAQSLNTSDYYLFDEFNEYVNHLPSVLIESRQPDGFITHIVNNRDLIISVLYTDIEDSSHGEVIDTSMSTSEIEIKSLLDFYDLDSKDGCNDLKEKINSLYKLFKIKTGIISASDLIVFQKSGKTYIGYVYNKDVKIKSVALTPYAQIEDNLNLNRLKCCVPINLFLDGIALADSIFENIGLTFDPKSLRIPKQKHKLTILLNTGTFLVNDDWDQCNKGILDIGLASKFTYSVRLSFYKYFEDIIGLEKTRELCDCFGGFNPKLCRIVKI